MRTGAGTAVEGGAADAPPLDERDLCAQLGGVQGGGHTSGAASDDDNAHLACSFGTHVRPLKREAVAAAQK